jgi:hypothetical protein
MPIAVLPMYDFPWTAAANDALWASMSARLAEAGVQTPAALARGGDLPSQWRDPGLIFGQACGYPYVTGLRNAVTLIAAPEYAFPGSDGAAHRSFIIRRAGDPRRELPEYRGSTAALNAHDSNTGMNLFRAAIAPIAGRAPFFRAIAVTGSHEASLTAVAEGRADLAAIDCVSFALLERGRPELVERVAVIAESPLSPGPAVHHERRPWGAGDRRGSRGAARGPRRPESRGSAPDAGSQRRASDEPGRV